MKLDFDDIDLAQIAELDDMIANPEVKREALSPLSVLIAVKVVGKYRAIKRLESENREHASRRAFHTALLDLENDKVYNGFPIDSIEFEAYQAGLASKGVIE